MSRKVVAPIAIVAVIIAGVALTEIWLRYAPGAAFFLLPFRIGEFAIGAALLWVPGVSIRHYSLENAGFAAGIAAIAASVLFFDNLTRFPGVAALLPCLGAALCIYCGSSFMARLTLANAPAVWIGRLSYSLYLVHWPIIVFAKYYLLRDLASAEVIFVIAVTFALAVLLYKCVEQPFRVRSGERPVATPRNIAAVSAGCIFLLAVPAMSAQIDGWRWRLPQRVVSAETFALHDVNYGGLKCDGVPCASTGDPAHPKVYVIGDSHARSLYAGLVRAFPNVNFIIYAPDGCGFYSISYWASYTSANAECRDQRTRAFKEISESDAPVIIFQLWSLYVRLPHHPDDSQDSSVQSAGTLDFSVFVSEQIDEMKVRLENRSVIVIGGLPTFASIGSPADCFSRPLQRLPCSTSLKRTRVDALNGGFNEAITATSNKTFIWIDPFKYLCDSMRCRNVTPDGQTIYADGDHLSVMGSEYLVALFRPIIAGELPNR